MAASEEFKQALRAGKLAEAFVIAMSKTPELEITTWIASPNQNQPVSSQSQPGQRLRTQINLVAGEIKNEIGDRFIANQDYQEVQQFHLDQVSRGHQTIKQNLLSLQQMFRLMAMLQNYQQGGEYREIGWLDIESQSLSSENATPHSNLTGENQSVQAKNLGGIPSTPTPSFSSQVSPSNPISHPPVQSNSASIVSDAPSLNGNSSSESNSWVNQSEGYKISDSYSTTFISAEEDDEENDLLSLADLEVEPESEAELQVAKKSVQEDWGEWLEEDEESEMAADILNIDSLELDEDSRWEELDDTEFLSNHQTKFNSQDK